MKLFNREDVAPVQVYCIYDAGSLEMWYVANVISILSDFFAAAVDVSNVGVDADNVVAVDSHEHTKMPRAGVLWSNGDVEG